MNKLKELESEQKRLTEEVGKFFIYHLMTS